MHNGLVGSARYRVSSTPQSLAYSMCGSPSWIHSIRGCCAASRREFFARQLTVRDYTLISQHTLCHKGKLTKVEQAAKVCRGDG